MIIDCQSDEWKSLPYEELGKRRRRVFLDGKELTAVWYADDEAGIVKTYHISQGESYVASAVNPQTLERFTFDLRNTKFIARGFNRSSVPADWEIEAPEDGVVSRTLRGKVELKPV